MKKPVLGRGSAKLDKNPYADPASEALAGPARGDANPYASPASETMENPAKGQPREMRIATRNERWINVCVDNFLVQGAAFWAAFLMFRLALPHEIIVFQMLIGMLTVVVSLAYYVGMEAAFRRTLGKFLTGTMVVTEDGRRPKLEHILVRSLVRLIPFEAFSFFGQRQPIGWHDRWSKTLVVKCR